MRVPCPVPPRLLLLLLSATIAPIAATARAQDTSALIGEALDRQPPGGQLELNGTLPDAVRRIGELTGVRVVADPAVWEDLPWGEGTTFTAKFQNQTLRAALGALCEKLGLTYALGKDAVELVPLPPLARIGRRSTVDELHALDLLASTPANLDSPQPTAKRLLEQIDDRLRDAKASFAVENRGIGDASEDRPLAVPRNASMLQALEAIPAQTDLTWFPSGNALVVLKKPEQIRLQLAKHMTTRYDRVEVAQVMLELAERAGVRFSFDPGLIQRVPEPFRKIDLIIDNASIEQILDSVCGYTGLAYAVTDDGLKFSLAGPTTGPASRPAATEPATTATTIGSPATTAATRTAATTAATVPAPAASRPATSPATGASH